MFWTCMIVVDHLQQTLLCSRYKYLSLHLQIHVLIPKVDINTTRLNHITDLSAQSHAFTLPNRRWLNVRNANWIGVNQVWNRRGVSFLPMSDKTKLHVGDRLSLKEISFPISGLFVQTKNNKCFVILKFFLRKPIRRESHLCGWNPKVCNHSHTCRQLKPTEQYFPVVQFIILHNVILTFES